jgi:hypothetical protein
MIQQLQRSPNPDPKKILSKILLEFVIEIQEPRKASNPQMIVKKILELVKPQYFKCVEIICNLIRKSDDYINEGREEQKITNLVENFAQNWQESDDSQHLQEIKNKIIESQCSLSLLSLYQQIINQNIHLDGTNSNDLEYLIDLGLIVREDNVLRVSNIVYEKVFNLSFVEQELNSHVNKLVSKEWIFTPGLREIQKEQIINLITLNIPQLAKKTNNLETLISLILTLSKPDIALLELLLKLFAETEDKNFISDNAQENLKSLILSYLIDNWETKSNSLSVYFQEIKQKLITNNNCDAFWLLVTYRYVLQGKDTPFNADQETQELLNFKIVLTNQANKLTVSNEIYQAIFDEQWIKKELALISQSQSQNILAWLDSNNFEGDITILQRKFLHNLKTIIEEILSWTHEHLSLTKKIVEFVGSLEVESENIKDWFEKNIIYSPNLGTYVNENDFENLIRNRVAKLEGVKKINQINLSLVKLTTKFRQNPLIIAEAVLEHTNGERKLIKNLVDLILRYDSIIRTEADGHKIPELVKFLENRNLKVLNMPKINIDQLLNQIVEEQEGLEAIVLINLTNGLAQYHNSDLRLNNERLFNDLFQTNRGISKALANFASLQSIPKALNTFGQETNKGQLDYAMFLLKNEDKKNINSGGLIVVYFTIFEGVAFAICYIATKEAFLASILLSCEESINQIRDGLKEKYQKYE